MIPDLTTYDHILINTSAGKDSQAAMDVTVQAARDAGVLERVLAVHCDLGRVEWKGTRELAEEQVGMYGLRFEVVARDRDLLHQIEHERKKWPDMARRFCTSDAKTSQVRKLITALARETKSGGVTHQPRILNVLGIRAAESPKRAKMAAFEFDAPASSGARHVDRWLPIHDWSTEQVWERIRASGVPHHPAYDLGMPRLSCVLCVFASREALLIGIKHNPELAQEYARVEVAIGHQFRQNLSIADLVAEAEVLAEVGPAPDWAA